MSSYSEYKEAASNREGRNIKRRIQGRLLGRQLWSRDLNRVKAQAMGISGEEYRRPEDRGPCKVSSSALGVGDGGGGGSGGEAFIHQASWERGLRVENLSGCEEEKERGN